MLLLNYYSESVHYISTSLIATHAKISLLELLRKTLLKSQYTPLAQVHQARLVSQESILGSALEPTLKLLYELAQRLAQKSIFELLHQSEALQLTNSLISMPTSQKLEQELSQKLHQESNLKSSRKSSLTQSLLLL
jgi:hypothetical protein